MIAFFYFSLKNILQNEHLYSICVRTLIYHTVREPIILMCLKTPQSTFFTFLPYIG